ncbi:MAG: hypothetical protein IJL39_03630 [Clostridia bacterium]|nr:hypothetical protein [Clostridia bacterium]
MKKSADWGYAPSQRMQWLRGERQRVLDRFAQATDPALIEALIYEDQSLSKQQSACICQAKEQAHAERMRREEAFFHE